MTSAARPDVRDASPRAPRRDVARNQAAILTAARAALAEHGVDARMDDIAARAQVGVGTVYRHFPNKDALVAELVRVILDDLVAAARAALARDDGTGLEQYLHALGRSFAAHHSYADELMGPASSAGGDLLRSLMAELLDQAHAHGEVAAHIRPDDVLATAWAVRGVVQASPEDDPDAWRRHLEIHLAGLRAPLLAPRAP